MKRYILFMVWNTQYYQFSPVWSVHLMSEILSTLSAGFCLWISIIRWIPKLLWGKKKKNLKQPKPFWKRVTVLEDSLSLISGLNHEATVVKTMWHWWKDQWTDERVPKQTCTNTVSFWGARSNQWTKGSFSKKKKMLLNNEISTYVKWDIHICKK